MQHQGTSHHDPGIGHDGHHKPPGRIDPAHALQNRIRQQQEQSDRKEQRRSALFAQDRHRRSVERRHHRLRHVSVVAPGEVGEDVALGHRLRRPGPLELGRAVGAQDYERDPVAVGLADRRRIVRDGAPRGAAEDHRLAAGAGQAEGEEGGGPLVDDHLGEDLGVSPEGEGDRRVAVAGGEDRSAGAAIILILFFSYSQKNPQESEGK